MNPTMTTFGYPGTCIHESEHWAVLLRPRQPTLGSLILVARSDAECFSDLPPEAFTELGLVIGAIERTLTNEFTYDKINYLMLMMVDRNVHFHVIPRYVDPRELGDVVIVDAGWPGPPDLKACAALSDDAMQALAARLRQAWSG